MFGFSTALFLFRVLLKLKTKQIFWAANIERPQCIIPKHQNKFIKLYILVAILIFLNPAFAVTKTEETTPQHKQHKIKTVKKQKQVTKFFVAAPPPPTTHIANTDPGTFKFMATIEKRVVHFIHNMIETLNYTSYKLGGTRFDLMRGVYILDCSSYVDFILKTLYPHAYSNLVNYSSSHKPTTHDYYQFFTSMTDEPQNYWTTIEDVEQLRPGDILVFRYKNTRHERVGHVMIVMDKPIRDKNTFFIRIADSAPHRHSRDTRLPTDSGIGIGTLLVKVDPKTYQPSAYAWKIGSPWRRNVHFAMARPFDINI